MSNKTTIDIDGNNKGAVVSINGVKQELGSLSNYIDGPFGSSIKSLQGYFSLAAFGGAVAGLAALTKQAIDSADEMNKLSQKIGVSVESLSTLKYAADLSDVSLEQLSTGLRKLSSNIYDVSKGVGQTVSYAFEDMNIAVTDTNGNLRLTEDVLLEVADKFSKMEDGTNKTALAVKLFGRSGADLIPFLNQGKEGISDLTEEAEKLGLKIGSDFAKDAEAFNDNLTTLGYITKGIGLGIAQELMPVLLSLSGALKTYTTDTQTAAKAGAGLADVLKGLVTGFGAIYAGAVIAGNALGTFYATMATFFSTGSFEQAGNVISMGFKKIEDEALSFGKAFDSLWSDNSAAYQNFIDSLNTDDGGSGDPTTKIRALYDAFGHPIDEDGNLTNNIKYIEALMKDFNYFATFKPEEMIANMPTYDMAQVMEPEFNPFDNIRFQAVDFFDMYDERAELMRQQTETMFGNMGNAAAMFYQASGQRARAWFEIQKGFNIAQAVMNTYEAATKALAQGGFFGIAMAATVIAAGLAQVAMIASQQPGRSGGGSGGASTGSFGASNISPRDGDRGTADYNKGPRQIIININGGYLYDAAAISRELVPHINNAIADGVS